MTTNVFYNYSGAFLPGAQARAEQVATEFTAVQAGFSAFLTGTGVFGISLSPPTSLVGLTAVGGTSAFGAPIDATYALDQTISPTWTGIHTYTATSTFSGGISVGGTSSFSGPLTVTGTASFGNTVAITGTTSISGPLTVSATSTFTGASAITISGPNAVSITGLNPLNVGGLAGNQACRFSNLGTSTIVVNNGVLVNAGYNTTDVALAVYSGTGTIPIMQVFADGGITIGNPVGGDKGAGTINVAGTIYGNGTAVTVP